MSASPTKKKKILLAWGGGHKHAWTRVQKRLCWGLAHYFSTMQGWETNNSISIETSDYFYWIFFLYQKCTPVLHCSILYPPEIKNVDPGSDDRRGASGGGGPDWIYYVTAGFKQSVAVPKHLQVQPPFSWGRTCKYLSGEHWFRWQMFNIWARTSLTSHLSILKKMLAFLLKCDFFQQIRWRTETSSIK